MSKPIIGVIASSHLVNDRFPAQMSAEKNLRAVAEVAGCMPVIFPGCPQLTDVGTLLDTVDGVLLTGGRANVHPSCFGLPEDPAHEPYDEGRDSVALAVTRACVDRGIPIFGVCRGIQEMAVAYGSVLHPEIRDLPGRMNHRAPRTPDGEFHPDPAVVFADRHDVMLTPGGQFARLLGKETIRVNSLHGQGVEGPGERIIVEGRAEDGTVEAICIAGATGFAMGVQWHAEHDPQTNAINRALFEAFGAACAGRKPAAISA